MIDTTSLLNTAADLSLKYLPKVFLALLTLVIGFWVIKIVNRLLGRAMKIKEIDVSLQRFLQSLASVLMKTVLLISVASMVGIEMTSFIALLGAAGLAVGLALQGSMANFAGGVLILLLRPFKVGDYIEAQGFAGGVKEIQIFNTILNTADNKTIIIPNGVLSNGSIINYSREATRRVDVSIGIGYGDDIATARKILLSLAGKDPRVLKDPKPEVRLVEFGDSSVNLSLRMWCGTADYWDLFFTMNENIKHAFDEQGISIPFPQHDVHLFQPEPGKAL